MDVGDIVKVKRGMTIEVAGEQTYIGIDERFIVIDAFKHNVGLGYLDYLDTGRVFLLGRRFVEVVSDVEESSHRHSLDKNNFNPAPKLNEQGILALIDIAIDTGDKQWFDELHSKLSALA